MKKDLKILASKYIDQRHFDPKSYEYDFSFKPTTNFADPFQLKTVWDLFEAAKRHPDKYEIDARVLAVQEGRPVIQRMNTTQFVESFKRGNRIRSEKRLREAYDAFLNDGDLGIGNLGDDFTPILGGPFNKQLYINDYLRMNAVSFFAWNHDPIGHAAVNMMVEFTLGRGYRVDMKDQKALAMWRAFEEANDLQQLMREFAQELSIYGESMIWWLPNNDTSIRYRGSDPVPSAKGYIPRVRLIDPSTCWEIITVPDDIKAVLAYQLVFPTQYQIYSSTDDGKNVGTSKFVYQQLTAEAVDHYKINSVSNEKRGRSDLFPALGYMKRLRDTINYAIVADQKKAAWAIDTTIQGAQTDIDAYIRAQEQLGTIAPAGSEFVHTDKIKREFQSPSGTAGKGQSSTFEWNLSMIASSLGFPISYFGTHISGGQTRASAIIASEPVAKKFEMRQQLYERVIRKLAYKFFTRMDMPVPEMEVTFPEIISQDRTAKLKDLALMESQGWISRERAANIAAKEMGITEFDYQEEQTEAPTVDAGVLTSPGEVKTSGLTSDEKKDVKDDSRG